MTKKEIKKKIKEFGGTHLYFLADYLEGGFEDYVHKNLEKIATRECYGRTFWNEKDWKDCYGYVLEQKVLQVCRSTVKYVNTGIIDLFA
mgnify:CR=1 FL=1